MTTHALQTQHSKLVAQMTVQFDSLTLKNDNKGHGMSQILAAVT